MIRLRKVVHRNEGGELLGVVVKVLDSGIVFVKPPHIKNLQAFVDRDLREYYEKSK